MSDSPPVHWWILRITLARIYKGVSKVHSKLGTHLWSYLKLLILIRAQLGNHWKWPDVFAHYINWISLSAFEPLQLWSCLHRHPVEAFWHVRVKTSPPNERAALSDAWQFTSKRKHANSHSQHLARLNSILGSKDWNWEEVKSKCSSCRKSTMLAWFLEFIGDGLWSSVISWRILIGYDRRNLASPTDAFSNFFFDI